MKTKTLNLFRKTFQIPFMEKWLRDKIKENSNNSFYPKLVPNNYQYKPNTFRKFVYKDAVILNADISDYVGHYLYFGFQDEGQEQLFNLVKEGDTVLDIGTNIGSTLLKMASIVEKEGIVYGFEPDPFNYENCIKNIQLNNFSNVYVNPIGLGENVGSFDLMVDTETNRGGNRITLKETDKKVTKIKVNTLDNWIKENKVSRIDVIKIDVEGFEYKVLKGGEVFLKNNYPTLFIELDDNNLKAVGDSATELIALLEEWDYCITESISGEKLKSSDDYTDCHYDIIARPK